MSTEKETESDSVIRARIMARIDAVKAVREAAGLHVHWTLPDGRDWSAYAKDEAQKLAWIESGKRKGWILK